MNHSSDNLYKNSIGSGNLKRLSALYVKRLWLVHHISKISWCDSDPLYKGSLRSFLVAVFFQINLIKKYK